MQQTATEAPIIHVYVIEYQEADEYFGAPIEYRADAICDELGIVGLFEDDKVFRHDTMCMYGFGYTPRQAVEDLKAQLIGKNFHGTLRVHR